MKLFKPVNLILINSIFWILNSHVLSIPNILALNLKYNMQIKFSQLLL